jgi:hypothetical protein
MHAIYWEYVDLVERVAYYVCIVSFRWCLYEKSLIDVSQVIQGHITILIHEQFCPGQVVFIQGS